MSNVSLIDGHIDDDVVTTKTLTDEQIIKAIERCIGKDFTALWYVETLDQRTPISMRDILRVISNQKAEIERLQKESIGKCEMAIAMRNDNNLDVNCNYCIDKAKSEAVKEFAERFENELTKIEEIYFDEEHENFISANKVIALLVNLVKEMAGEG